MGSKPRTVENQGILRQVAWGMLKSLHSITECMDETNPVMFLNSTSCPLQVGTICVVCKALFNLCAEGAKSSSLADKDLGPLEGVLLGIQQSQELMTKPEVPQVRGGPRVIHSNVQHHEHTVM